MGSGIRRAPVSARAGRRRRTGNQGSSTLAALLAAAVERNPDGIAVVCDNSVLTYRELCARAARLARVLLKLGAGPETAVAMVLPRSLDSVLAVWAIAQTGAAFVPIDPGFPRSRIEFMVADCAATIGLTNRQLLETLPGGVSWLALDAPEVSAESDEPVSYADRPPLRGSNPAYLIYTSGSTGRPKGVTVTHAGLAGFCAEQVERYALTSAARTLHFASPSFDASVLELLLAVGASATMVIAPPTIYGGAELAELIARHGVTHAFMTPSALASLEPAGLHTLGTIVVGGEPCPPALVDRWTRNGVRFHNGYGPTETTIMTAISAPLAANAPVNIGSAVRGMTCRVLDQRLCEAGIGVAGELYVSGPGVARGYHDRAGLTAQRFLADPHGAPGARMYRTGDLVRRRTGDELDYVGRTDDQVKIRGFRVELGEIDATLSAHPDVRWAVAVDRKTAAGETVLTAYVQLEPGVAPSVDQVMDAAVRQLPPYLVPNSITIVDRIPLTPTGKADRAALRARTVDDRPTYRPPSDQAEKLVAEVFARVLCCEQVGADDNFFASGGNSLLATQVAARLSGAQGVRVPARLVFDHPTVSALALALRSQRFDASRPVLEARPRPERVPLSPAQQRFWLRNQIDTTGAVDNIGFALRLSGSLELSALRAALADTVVRHEILRTMYPADAEGPHQLVCDTAAVDFAVEEIEPAAVDNRVREFLRQGFDVTAEVPLRVRLLRTPTAHVLVCSLHHICADGSSLAPLARDLTTAYAARYTGAAPAWPPLTVQYTDYALWQRELLGANDDPNSVMSRELSYWTTELDGHSGILDLPTDRPRLPTVASPGAAVQQRIPATTHQELLAVAGENGATLFMVMRAALAVLLARVSGDSDISLGVPVTNRAEPVLDDLVGLFVNTVVSRTRITLGESFTGLLTRTRDHDLEAFAHSEVPFELVVDAVDPVRAPGRHPLYQVGFAFQNFTPPELELSGLDISFVDVGAGAAKTDLSVTVEESRAEGGAPGPINIRFEYAADLFDESTVRRFLDGYVRILAMVATEPSIAVGDIGIVDPTERQRIRSLATGADHPVPSETLTEALRRHAAAAPDATAVICGSESVTYAQLFQRCNRLARWLIEQGVGPETVVAVAMRRSIEQVIALCAIVEAGGAWLPVDPDHPAEHVRYVLDSAAPLCVLTTSPDAFTGAHTVDTIDLTAFDAGPIGPAERRAPLHGRHPAYLIYTSGSTGRPKGVVVDHRAIVNQLDWLQHHYRVDAADAYLQKSPATFDASVWGYFLPLRSGARLVLTAPGEHRDPAALCQLIAAHRVTLTDFVPSALAMLAAHAAAHPATVDLSSLRAVFVGGEMFSPSMAGAFRAICRAEVHNVYGPTETAISVLHYRVAAADLEAANIPIGLPEWNCQVHVLDQRLREVPVGTAGELYVSGAQLARGYQGSPGLTAGRFVAHPHGRPGERMYRTGDVVRWSSRGLLNYVGRSDFQVKVRGHRIELGAIEAALLADTSVGQAVVSVKPSDSGDRLVGYVVASPGAVVEPDLLRQRISRSLPAYMVPAAVMSVTSLPVNGSGKVDRAALPEPTFTSRSIVAPSTPLEQAIADVFADVLGVASLGIDDDFFDLGGSSILAFTLHRRLSNQLDREVPMSVVLAAPTVGGIAAFLTGAVTPNDTVSPAEDTILDAEIDSAACESAWTGAPREVLLTGATGFLGAYLLRELLDRTNARVWCLVRAASATEAIERIRETLRTYHLPDDGVADRVLAVPGDLAAARLGLSDADHSLLADRVDAVFHNGARVNHIEPYPRLRAANVGGTRELLRLATTGRLKPVHFVSTISIATPDGSPTEVPDNGYLASKWVAEELIRQAGERDVPVTIHRPGMISGDPRTGINSTDDSFWNMIRAVAILGIAPEVADATVSLVPVNYVARAIVAISAQPRPETAFHLINRNPVAVRDIFACLRDHGLPVATTTFEVVAVELIRESHRRDTAGDASLVRAALLGPNYVGFGAQSAWDDTPTRAALAGTNIECPVVDRPVLDAYIREFVLSGFLPKEPMH